MSAALSKDRELKGLQSQLAKHEAEAKVLRSQQSSVAKELHTKDNLIKGIKSKISELNKKTSSEIKVTEHAMLRYFERVLGFNLNEISSKILDSTVLKCIETLGNGEFPNETSEFKVVVKNNTVTTIVDI